MKTVKKLFYTTYKIKTLAVKMLCAYLTLIYIVNPQYFVWKYKCCFFQDP